jgi:hypothetical protein
MLTIIEMQIEMYLSCRTHGETESDVKMHVSCFKTSSIKK